MLPPDNVVRHDSDDPYLVVAADKGTATFSDTANEISISRNFWLGDAFASGGSAGYDHKKMGITARGAWEAVKRHFREMDIDIGVTPFTVTGVGDMSGDVFGNGMLRETTIKLVAAFDHRDIFIDPQPDPVKSFAERQRLFDLPRSSWQDYDKALISKGGGVFPRTLKEIPLSPEMKALLNLTADKATPAQVMSAILKSEADLLFFGGIGTYVRASSETDEQVGDRANDAIRVIGSDLNCKVIGEGANLGMTQRGRIEAAHNGVRLNTDAIDNSAGVNTSDVEVNIKIALADRSASGALPLHRTAIRCCSTMTDEVAALVLRNNYLQTLAISLAERSGMDDLASRQRLMQTLEGRGLLDRSVEFLPDDAEIAERRRSGSGADAAGACGAARLCQAHPEQRPQRDLGAGRSLSRQGIVPVFPGRTVAALSGCAGASSAAARNHRHAADQFDHQSRRPLADRAPDRRDRRVGRPDRACLRRGARQLRHDRTEWRDRCARQQDSRARCSSICTRR